MRQRKMKLFPNVPIDPVIDRGTPWNDLSDDEKEYQANKFEVHAAMVDSVDQGIGRILDALKKSGEYDNTVIFFCPTMEPPRRYQVMRGMTEMEKHGTGKLLIRNVN